jgi:hypothetical protein
MKTIVWHLISLLLILLGIFSCGPSEKEKAQKIEERNIHVKDSITKDEQKFSDFYNETKNRFKNDLIKDGDYFFDYSAGTIKVPEGCVWQLGKYNVWARKWDTALVNDPDIADPCLRERLFGDKKPLFVGKEEHVIDVNKIIINNVPMTIPAAPCADKNSATINMMTGANTDWNRLIITKVYLPPGTSVCVPSNRIERNTGTHGILTITQYKLKDKIIIDDFQTLVKEQKKRHGKDIYPTWNLSDSLTNNKLDLIGEISNNKDWYKPF